MIFVTGMFRSGTTFVARLLNQSDEISFASDPFFAILKDFRNTLSNESAHKVDPHAPLEDYYFDENKFHFFKKIQNTNLGDVKIPNLKYLKEFTEASSFPYSELLSKQIHKISANNYGDFLRQGEQLLREVYGNKRLSGFKEVWANEFAPHIINVFPNTSKVIHIIRDPRAILVSNFYSEGRYPILFLARQWRKLATLAYHYSKSNQNNMIIKYEDLILNPKETIQGICNFVGINFDEKLLSTEEITDGGNKKWTQNSTFQEKSSSGFNQSSVNRWKDKIKSSDRMAIEFLCYPEMKLLGYTDFLDESFKDISSNNLIDEKDKLAKWIIPYSELNIPLEFEKENNRRGLLTKNVTEKDKELNFLVPSVYEELKSILSK
ncbi:sulfotransferase family protein [Leptospira levettii]|uniref:sulfotransferase family protein n=1 Tax=Leptospira levettii TaxID=2023178 RepID=UPI00108240F3|nr:sulfotransferase [Leptospira levettii]TGM25927.1 sulfotransferase [Leptospira levettii]TGM33438.1 sulfotransferase [Leptospira levettii]TGM82653.1 sulfotransferase [Leptospira levettii]